MGDGGLRVATVDDLALPVNYFPLMRSMKLGLRRQRQAVAWYSRRHAANASSLGSASVSMVSTILR